MYQFLMKTKKLLRFNIPSVSNVTVCIIRLFRFGVYHFRKASVKESISFFDEKMSGRKWNLRLIIRYGSLKFDITNLRFARKTIKVSFEIVFFEIQ